MAKIDGFFEELIRKGGSDLHLEQGQPPKMRLNGRLIPLDQASSLSETEILALLQEITSSEQWAVFSRTGDLDFAYSFSDQGRFRANYFRHAWGYGGIFRLIPSKILTLQDLGLPETIEQFARLRSGLVVITGPTGSGKSTTLAALINHINTHQSKKIITIEEPVEFLHPSKKSLISHREVGLDTVSFTSGLKGAIKSDADIILVGEMRDRQTIRLALKAAEMGILVFGTLHTNSASKTVDRIIDVFPANQKNQIRTILANTLKGVVAQQLVRAQDGQRRWCACEILVHTPALPSIILSGETTRLVSEMQINKARGMILMDDCLKRLCHEGKIDPQEAYMKAIDKAAFVGFS